MYTHRITPATIKPFLKPRAKNSHKGTFGHVFTIAGSKEKVGAALMSAYTALKIGAGLSTLILPDTAYKKIINPKKLELMYAPVKKWNCVRVLSLLKNASVVALGPGLGTSPKTISFVHQLIQKYQGPLVIDADGLNALAKNPALLQKRKKRITLLTPHPAEMGRLIGHKTSFVQKNRIQVAHTFAKKWGVTLLLKGYRSVVAMPNGQVWINPTGNPAMASAGQGDVLTGIYAGLMAQFPDNPNVFLFGCFLHGLVGDILAQKKRVVLATDIADNLHLGYS